MNLENLSSRDIAVSTLAFLHELHFKLQKLHKFRSQT